MSKNYHGNDKKEVDPVEYRMRVTIIIGAIPTAILLVYKLYQHLNWPSWLVW